MRWARTWLTLILLLAFVCQTFLVVLHAAVAHVQTISMVYPGNNDTTYTSDAFTVTEGSLLIVGATSYAGNDVAGVALDMTGRAFQEDRSAMAGEDRAAIWSLPNVAAGSHTVTVTWASAVYWKQFVVTEVSGAATVNPIDVAMASAFDTDTCDSGSYAADATSFWYGLAVPINATGMMAGSGWTIPANGSPGDMTMEYMANPGTSPHHADMTGSIMGNCLALGVAYHVPVSGGGASHRQRLMRGLGVVDRPRVGSGDP